MEGRRDPVQLKCLVHTTKVSGAKHLNCQVHNMTTKRPDL